MKNLKIGENIYDLRKEKRITQEKLAEHLNLSTPAISKWESGQSYPDITLLPELASFFDVTIDSLLGYVPSLSREEVDSFYTQTSRRFMNEDFDAVYSDCMEMAGKYQGSYYLHLQIGLLVINYLEFIPDQRKVPEILTEISELLKKITVSCEDGKICHQARYVLGIAYIYLGDGSSALSVLEQAADTMLPPELLRAQAYQLMGKAEDSAAVLECYIYQCLVGLLNACPTLAFLRMSEPEKAKKAFRALFETTAAFDFMDSNPMGVGQTYLPYAKLLMLLGEEDSALSALEKLAEIMGAESTFPVKFKETGIFDNLSKMYEYMDRGNSAPRNDEAIKKSGFMAVTHDPAFAPLAENHRFKAVVQQLETLYNEAAK